VLGGGATTDARIEIGMKMYVLVWHVGSAASSLVHARWVPPDSRVSLHTQRVSGLDVRLGTQGCEAYSRSTRWEQTGDAWKDRNWGRAPLTSATMTMTFWDAVLRRSSERPSLVLVEDGSRGLVRGEYECERMGRGA
jgi:hypothetical protein